ncbi:MAG: hypothetical protein HZB25_11695 [Candidatus Eisenbacteria bacterium]|nr:hypothetical protein [Candidatus Eisenbacteria bacterium]
MIVHPASEVLERYITWNGSTPVFNSPDGYAWELVTSPQQAGPNAGDGSFHPMDQTEVESALRGVRFPLGGVTADVFILPYPRREVPASSAGSGCLVLTPGVRAYSREEIHSVVTHELGHLVQAALLPDTDTEGWARYRGLRGISDVSVYFDGASHANRPHEIFAEDFRFLFGDAASRASGTIENPSLELPNVRPAVSEFLAGLHRPAAASLEAPGTLSNGPNPFTGRTVLTFSVSATSVGLRGSALPAAADAASAPVRVRLGVYGADGRLVRQLVEGEYVPGTHRVVFDGRDQAGQALPAGVWFARLESGSKVAVRKLILSR